MPSLTHAKNKPIIIGEINSYIPNVTSFTTPYRKGWTLALEETYKNGGINGRPLKVVVKNDHGDEGEAKRLAEQLIDEHKAILLCGTYFSNIGLSVSEIANKRKIPFIAAEPLSDKITLEKGNPFTFRVRPNTYMQTNMLAKEASKLPVSRWVCVAPDYEYGHSAVENFKQFMEIIRPDIEWLPDEFTPLFNIDPKKTIEKFSNYNVEAIFNATFSSDLDALLKEADQTDYFKDKAVVSILSGEPEYLKNLTSPSCNGWIVTGYPWDQIVTNSHQSFVKNYQSRFEEPPSLGSLVGYITLSSIAKALAESEDHSPEAIIKTFENLYVDTPIGMIHFRDIDHQSSMGAFVGRLAHKDGKNEMTQWYYADGSEYWPSANIVRRRRPKV